MRGRFVLAIAVLVAMSSAAGAQWWGYEWGSKLWDHSWPGPGSLGPAHGNDTSGIIPWSCENELRAYEIAAEHCRGYRKFARITSVRREYGNYIGFNCLWDPTINPFALPAVRTGNVCRLAEERTERLWPKVRIVK